MKKKLSLGLALLMSFSLSACGGSSDGNTGDNAKKTETVVENDAFQETLKQMKENYTGDDAQLDISDLFGIYEDYISENYGARKGEFSDIVTQRDGYNDEYYIWTYRVEDVNTDEDLNVGVISLGDTTMCKGEENENHTTNARVSIMDENNKNYQFYKDSYYTSGDSMYVNYYINNDMPLYGSVGNERMKDDVYSVAFMFGLPDERTIEFTDDCIKISTTSTMDVDDEYSGKYTSTTTIESELYADHMSSTVNKNTKYESGETGKEVMKLNVTFEEAKTLDEIKEMCKDIIDVATPYEGESYDRGTQVDTGWSDIEAKFNELLK